MKTLVLALALVSALASCKAGGSAGGGGGGGGENPPPTRQPDVVVKKVEFGELSSLGGGNYTFPLRITAGNLSKTKGAWAKINDPFTVQAYVRKALLGELEDAVLAPVTFGRYPTLPLAGAPSWPVPSGLTVTVQPPLRPGESALIVRQVYMTSPWPGGEKLELVVIADIYDEVKNELDEDNNTLVTGFSVP